MLVALDVLATSLTIGTSAGPSTRLLATAGVVLLVSTALTWGAQVWAGWSLIFLAGRDGRLLHRRIGRRTWPTPGRIALLRRRPRVARRATERPPDGGK